MVYLHVQLNLEVDDEEIICFTVAWDGVAHVNDWERARWDQYLAQIVFEMVPCKGVYGLTAVSPCCLLKSIAGTFE